MTHLDSLYSERRRKFGPTKFVTVGNERRLAYKEEDLGGQIVLAFHGSCMGKLSWLPVEPIGGVRLISVDRMGSGESTTVIWDEYSMAEEMVDILQLVEQLDLRDFFVAGFSAGGTLALRTAAQCPSRVRGCLAVSATTDCYHPQAPKDLQKGIPVVASGQFRGCCGGAVFRWLITSAVKPLTQGDGMPPHKLEKMGNDQIKNDCVPASRVKEIESGPNVEFDFSRDWDDVRGGFTDTNAFTRDCYSRTQPWPEDLSKIACPVLLYHGALDNDVKLAEAEFSERVIPRASLVKFESDSHHTMATRKHDALAAALQQWSAPV
ncbi:hypothetical protein CYMTET_19991 [Cymbomonas tetramitiformis]|uniref:AB hydrolase-1 domain-containing protein n=1 Tax=Cymbomonas tetramitiformis TaxID=36881 RepID=A0AAE0G4W8_9CHLO|nr:hypothetical protein CYMTET_19991 [Cymbomonas tetramitiformis]